MIQTYTIPENIRQDIQKTVATYQRKAQRYGFPLEVEFGYPYVKEFPIYVHDRLTREKVQTMPFEVFDLTIESEVIRKGDYHVIARIEHLEDGNVVKTFSDTDRLAWATMGARCQHCGKNHGQKVTFIVRDAAGEEKQVGRTCLKDYCGIDPQNVGRFNELIEIMLDAEADRYDFDEHEVPVAMRTMKALALAVMIQRTKGFRSSKETGSNKEALASLMAKDESANEQDNEQAEAIAKALDEMDVDTAFDANLNNVKTLLKYGFCKASDFGYIAYAPLAYQKYLEKLERQKAREVEKAAERASEYIGEIGQRMTVEVKEVTLVTSWETAYGFTYLHKLIDMNGNVLIWYASKVFGHWVEDKHGVENWEPYQGRMKIKATVKDHTERDGVKQTVITRCTAA